MGVSFKNHNRSVAIHVCLYAHGPPRIDFAVSEEDIGQLRRETVVDKVRSLHLLLNEIGGEPRIMLKIINKSHCIKFYSNTYCDPKRSAHILV